MPKFWPVAWEGYSLCPIPKFWSNVSILSQETIHKFLKSWSNLFLGASSRQAARIWSCVASTTTELEKEEDADKGDDCQNWIVWLWNHSLKTKYHNLQSKNWDLKVTTQKKSSARWCSTWNVPSRNVHRRERCHIWMYGAFWWWYWPWK